MSPQQQGDAEQHRGIFCNSGSANNACWAGGQGSPPAWGKAAMENKPRQPRWGFWGCVSNSQKLLQGRCKLQVTVLVRYWPTLPRALFLVEQLQHTLPFQQSLLHPAWQAMPGAAFGSPRSHFCHLDTEEQSTLPTWHLHWDDLVLERPNPAVSGGIISACNCAGRLESRTLQWCPCQTSGLSQPIPTLPCHGLQCPCTSHFKDLTHT